VAVSVITVPLAVLAVTCTTNCTVPLEPAGAAAAVQVVEPVAPATRAGVHVVPVGTEIDTNVVLGGVVSIKLGFVAVALPTFVAVCV